jgi:hypothetical protein
MYKFALGVGETGNCLVLLSSTSGRLELAFAVIMYWTTLGNKLMRFCMVIVTLVLIRTALQASSYTSKSQLQEQSTSCLCHVNGLPLSYSCNIAAPLSAV